MHGSKIVSASSEIVLYQDAIATNDIALSKFLREDHLSAEVRGLNHDVLFTQNNVLVKLDTECAFEHRIWEDAPLLSLIHI